MRGTVARLTTLSSILRQLHLVDEATTLDITPTVLYMMGLAVGADMDGRILFEDLTISSKTLPVRWIATWGKPSGRETRLPGRSNLREKLKALGYIQ